MCVDAFASICMYACIYPYVHIHIYRERGRERERWGGEGGGMFFVSYPRGMAFSAGLFNERFCEP